MTKRMLIDGTHAEETRVVVLDGNRLEDFDVETSTKQQLKGNIYLAKVVRVEPSLQAAFVEYGGTRHGFLAFGEIHPDYYQIPVADRQRLIAQQEEEAREAEAAEDEAARADEAELAATSVPANAPEADAAETMQDGGPDPEAAPGSDAGEPAAEPAFAEWPVIVESLAIDPGSDDLSPAQPAVIAQDRLVSAETYSEAADNAGAYDSTPEAALAELGLEVGADGEITGDPQAMADLAEAMAGNADGNDDAEDGEADAELPPAPAPETLGGEAEHAEEPERRPPSRYLRNYKIQEVIRRRQIMLVQVVKEERGGKGAALTTYISLAGRFCVLMPNSPRGGGISRKITSAADRRRLKEITTELEIPSGMGLIVRTAGAARPKPEIRRDCEYLLQLWDDIRDTTMKSVAPALIYEEASLIKRVIRDVYSRDVDEVLVDGQAAWQAARDQMRLLMPSHAHKVQLWADTQPLFAAQQVDVQLDAMLSPTVQLRSGGYLVINQTEALVAVDVNSGRSTRERGIEETALRTNMEAAEEVARQLRLRDLAGLIVIDFIDMEARKHNAMVERKLKESLKNDRARIQLGSISHFGLMEMSRQRLRPSLTETSFVQCPHCGGAGHVRSTEGSAIQVLRAIEEEGGKRKAAEIMVHVAGPIAMYILNHKRVRLAEIEQRYGMVVLFTPDPALLPPAVKIDRLRTHAPGEAPALPPRPAPAPSVTVVDDDDVVLGDAPEAGWGADDAVEAAPVQPARPQRQDSPRQDSGRQEAARDGSRPEAAAEGDAGARRRRRRRRRGGRREDQGREDGARDGLPALAEPGAEQPDLPPFGDVGEPLAGESAPSAAILADPQPPVEAAPEPQLDAPADRPEPVPQEATIAAEPSVAKAVVPAEAAVEDEAGGDEAGGDEAGGARRRGRRGGRRRAKDAPAEGEEAATAPAPAPYSGPTPADPFGGGAFDIFDAIEQAVQKVKPAPAPRRSRAKAAVAAAVPAEAAAPAPEPEPQPFTAEINVAPLPERIEAPEAVADTPVEPLAKPVLVDDAPTAPKRGWWRR